MLKTIPRRLRAAALALLALLAAGCGDKATVDATGTVSGTIRLDGKPLEEGTITFSIPGKVPHEAKITAGSYSVAASVGANKVTFAAYKDQAQKKATGPGADQATKQNVLPDQYHAKSEVTFDVKSGANTFDYELKSK